MTIQEKLQNIENEDLNSIINLDSLIKKYRFEENCHFAISKNYSIEGVSRTFREPSQKISSWERPNKNDEFYDIFFREHTGIILLYKKNPQAIISFQLIRNNELYLTQNKGINLIKNNFTEFKKIKDPVGLRYIDAIPFMFSLGLEYSKYLDVKNLLIQSLKNRNITNFNINQELEFRLLKIFDVNPYWMEFKQKENGDWFKEI